MWLMYFNGSRPPAAGVSGHVEWACLSAILSTALPHQLLGGFVQMDAGSRRLAGLPAVCPNSVPLSLSSWSLYICESFMVT